MERVLGEVGTVKVLGYVKKIAYKRSFVAGLFVCGFFCIAR